MSRTVHPHRTVVLPVRRLAAGLPALALVGSGVGLVLTGGHPATEVVADSGPLVTVPGTAIERREAPVLPRLPELSPPAELEPTGPYQPAALPSSFTVNGIPTAALEAYQRAARLVDAADAECRVDWALIAAIGKVESDHGRYGGNGIDRDGTVRPGIYGIPLNGADQTAVIHDTDGGAIDRDTSWDRAVGPMQFIPGTWRTVGVDANADGRKDPQNFADAATAAAVYLCSGPGDLGTEPGARQAVLRYNHSDAYADQVLAIARGYRAGYTVIPQSDLTDQQRIGTPYLPTGERRTMAHYDPAVASKPAPEPTATQPAGSTSEPSATSPTPAPSPSATSGNAVDGVVSGVTDVVTGVVGGGTSSPSPTTSSPSPTSTSAPLPLRVLPVGGACPDGYDPVLDTVGVTVLCVLHR